MIPKYADHAANERTFLAWIRTGIAVVVFGFVVEKFNLFMLVMAGTVSPEAAQRLSIDQSARLFGRYDGLALILLGVGLMVVAALRFFRTAKLIEEPEPRPAPSAGLELVFHPRPAHRSVMHLFGSDMMRRRPCAALAAGGESALTAGRG